MGVWGAIIGAIGGAAAGGISSYLLTKKNAEAYEEYAKDIRKAAQKYSGQNAYGAMQNAGMQEANIVNRRNLDAQASLAPSNMTNKASNAANLKDNYSQGYNLGSQNQKTALDAAYNADTAKAQQALNQANINYQAGTAATQAAMNTAGGLASLYGQMRGMNSGSGTKADGSGSATGSDERIKEYNNHSGLPKADVDDALRRIESINYKYKDGTGLDNKEHTGVTAQSVENTAFDGMVSENENGVKQLDKQMMLEAVLAGIASLRKELDELEGNKGDKITSDERCKEAAAKQLENKIESGSITPEQLPEGSPIQKEAEQLTDSNPHNDEVKNEAVEKYIETEEKKPSAGINWDNVKVYKPEESSSNLVSGYRYDEDGNLVNEYGRELKDFEPIDTKGGVLSHKDEDFLGPDEYIDENGNIQVDPNWKPENADEDFVGPDEQLMPLGNRDLIPPDNYNHDFDYDIEELDRQPGTPEEAEFESKIADVNDKGLLKAKPTDIGGSSVGIVSNAPLAQAERHTGGNAIGTKGILPAAALHFSPSSVSGTAASASKQFDGAGKVGNIGKPLNPLNADASVIQGKQSESSGFVTNNGGNLSSGGTNFRSSLGHIDPAKLPSEVEEHTAPEYESLLEAENLKDALINRINMMLDEMDPRTLKQLGFSPDNHYYKGNSLTKLDGATLNMLSEMLEDYTE